MNTSEVEALFALTLLGDYDSDEAWEAVAELRRDGSREIFERAAGWCSSDDPPCKRARSSGYFVRAPARADTARSTNRNDPSRVDIPRGGVFPDRRDARRRNRSAGSRFWRPRTWSSGGRQCRADHPPLSGARRRGGSVRRGVRSWMFSRRPAVGSGLAEAHGQTPTRMCVTGLFSASACWGTRTRPRFATPCSDAWTTRTRTSELRLRMAWENVGING